MGNSVWKDEQSELPGTRSQDCQPEPLSAYPAGAIGRSGRALFVFSPTAILPGVLKELMTKPRKPRPDVNRKAPRPAPKAPSPSTFPPGARAARPNSAGVVPISPHPQSPANAAPGARISRRAADRLRSGHLWVYASDIEAIDVDETDPQALLPVADNRGLLLGTALYSPASQIALRIVSREAIGKAEWLDLLAKRLFLAVDRRALMLNAENVDSDSCRLCFSEADEIPGLVVDKYGELVILQLLAKGLDSKGVRDACIRVL